MTEQPNTVDGNDRDAKLRQAYSLASQELRQTHQQEFNDLRVKHSKALGVDWTPRPTKDEKAEQELERLLAENPALVDRLAERLTPATPTETNTPTS